MQTIITDDHQSSESIDLIKYLLLLWHWAWVIVLAVLIAGSATYFISKIIPPVYQAKTTVLVDMAPSNKSLDYNTLLLSSQLTQTYSQMITKSPVLSEVATRLALPKVDAKTITAKPVTNTQLINLTVESTDPKLAADIANTLVLVFAEQVQSFQTTRFSDSKQNLQAQMTDIENKIKAANDQLSTATDPTEIDQLETTIANYSQTYASLLQSFEQVRLTEAQSRSSIVLVEPATVPTAPVSPRILLNTAIAAILGAVLAAGVIIGIDLLNDTVKTPEEINNKLGLPVLGVISHYKNNGIPITEAQPLSPVSEAFRTLRTNVQYAGAGFDKPVRSIMITSAMPGEGKTAVLVNLGVVLAQKGLRVLLIDGDLRRAQLHHRLDLDNLYGLSQIFVHPELGMDGSLQSTRIKGLSVITSGDSPPNPSELLGSQLMGSILEEVETQYDIILIDTPPALAVTDAAAMLPYVDGVLIVIKPGATTMAPLRRLIDQFHQLDGRMLGAVLNDINLHSSSYGYYYKHYKYYNDYRYKDGTRQNKRNGSNHLSKTQRTIVFKQPIRQMIRSLSLMIRNI